MDKRNNLLFHQNQYQALPTTESIPTASKQLGCLPPIEASLVNGAVQVCRGKHSSPTALASAAHTLLFLLYKLPDRTLSDFAAGNSTCYSCQTLLWSIQHTSVSFQLAQKGANVGISQQC